MNSSLSLLFVKKLNELCGLDDDNLIYSLLPSISNDHHSLNSSPLIIDSGIQILANQKTNAPKSSDTYKRIKEEKEKLFNILSESKGSLKIKEVKAGDDKIGAALAVISSIYFNTFTTPTQFFLPHTSLFSGYWDFWDKVNYLELKQKSEKKEVVFKIKNKLAKSDVWGIKFKPEDFPEIVKRRLAKEKLFYKKLDPAAMIKAMIIRMGELAKPSINYEVIDFSIRSFFTYLEVKQYLRIDREILFLRRFEEEMKGILASVS